MRHGIADCGVQLDMSPTFSPTFSKRNRQFSQVRQQHSQRIFTCNQDVSRKQGKTPLQRSMISDRSISQTTHKKPKQKFYPDGKPESPIKKLCVGCYNKQLSSAKKEQERLDEFQLKNSTQNITLINGQQMEKKINKYSNTMEQTNRYNQWKIKQNIEKKDKIRKDKEKIEDEYRNMREINKIYEVKREQQSNEKMLQLQKELQRQIQLKKVRLENQNKQQNIQMEAIFCQANRQKLDQINQQQYRKDLKKQITDNRVKRQLQQQQQKQRKKQEESKALQEKAELEKLRKQHQQKQNKLNEMQMTSYLQHRRKKNEEKIKQQQFDKKQVKASENNFREEEKQKNLIHRHKYEQYLQSLRKQMADNELKKKQEHIWVRSTLQQPFIQRHHTQVDCCYDCSREYPQSYLTKIIDLGLVNKN